MHSVIFILKTQHSFYLYDLQHVDYEGTLAKKLSIAKKIFDVEKDVILNSSSFSKFFLENEVETFSISHNTRNLS